MQKPQLFEPIYVQPTGRPTRKREWFEVVKAKTLAFIRIDLPTVLRPCCARNDTKRQLSSVKMVAPVLSTVMRRGGPVRPPIERLNRN